MKKLILSLSLVSVCTCAVMAQDKAQAIGNGNTNVMKAMPASTHAPVATAPATTVPKTSLVPADMNFKPDIHDFGTVPEGPAAVYEFHFTNTGKEPIIVERVQASCGCTTPSYSKDPVLPGKEGSVKASFNTNGRPGNFTKTITVVSNAGTKVVTIKGTVEKAPTSSVPQNNSMIKTN